MGTRGRRTTTRTVEFLEMPSGPGLLSVLPRLAAALAGIGPALAPVAAGDTAQMARLGEAFGIGRPLRDEEDDPADPTAVVIATSGSTGPPKGSLLSRSALAASASATGRRLGPPGSWLLTLPAQHIAGLQVLLRAAASGSTPHLLDTDVPFTTQRFAAATGRLPSGPRYVSLVPTQLHRLLEDDSGTAALRSFTAVLVGGAATRLPLLARGRRAGVTLVTTYGMSETCGGCVYDGLPLDGVEVTVDGDGRIRLSGPVVGRGYRNLPRDRAFSCDAETGRRMFTTDDLGEWVSGRLEIRGRIDEAIVTGGLKIAPARLEAAIAAAPGVAEVVVVGVPDAEWGALVAAVVVPADRIRPPELVDLRDACDRAGVPRALHPRFLTLVQELPLRGPGKPDRTAAAALAARSAPKSQPKSH